MAAQKNKLTVSGILLLVLAVGGVWLWEKFVGGNKAVDPKGGTAVMEPEQKPGKQPERKKPEQKNPFDPIKEQPKTTPKRRTEPRKQPTKRAPEKKAPTKKTPTRHKPTKKAAPTKAPKPSRFQQDDTKKIAQAQKYSKKLKYCEVAGTVKFTLPDDLEGHKHQQWVMTLSNGMTVKVAHNIDLAHKVPLRKGDKVRVHGEYIPNARGGVLHWTHHDPKKWRKDGCIIHNGKTYK